jgi:hypothetical protein
MKPIFFTALLVCTIGIPGHAADDPKPHISRLAHIDLELTHEQYKQARMEQFRAEMQIKLLQTDDSSPDEGTVKHQLKRLEERSQILRNMADELRAKAIQIESDLSEHSREKVENVSATESGAAATAEGELRKRMLGTWQLVSFVDGRVSEGNVGELKFIGDRHWSVSRLKPGTGRLDYHMGGTYTLNGDEYVETIEYGTGGPIGETFTYKLSVEGDKFTQIGDGNPWSLVFKRAK